MNNCPEFRIFAFREEGAQFRVAGEALNPHKKSRPASYDARRQELSLNIGIVADIMASMP
jgi:hypothetical protein